MTLSHCCFPHVTSGFKIKELRGKLAIGLTANFVNRHTKEEARVQEISGVARIYNQKFFQALQSEIGTASSSHWEYTTDGLHFKYLEIIFFIFVQFSYLLTTVLVTLYFKVSLLQWVMFFNFMYLL